MAREDDEKLKRRAAFLEQKRKRREGDAKGLKGKGIVSSEVRTYANDPFFVKKAEEARKTLLRVGLPGDKKKQQ